MDHYRILHLELVSAKHLRKCPLSSKMDVYAVVSVLIGDAGKLIIKKATPLSRNGGSNPSFNYWLSFKLDEYLLNQRDCLYLEIKLLSDLRPTTNPYLVGTVRVPVKELFNLAGPNKMMFFTCKLRGPRLNEPKGKLSCSYVFGDKVTVSSKFSLTAPSKLNPAISSKLKKLITRVNTPQEAQMLLLVRVIFSFVLLDLLVQVLVSQPPQSCL